MLSSYLDALSQVIRNGQNAGQIDSSLDSTAVSRLLLSVYYGLELQIALDSELGVDAYAAAVQALLRGILARA